MTEVWKEIPEYNGAYKINRLGIVVSCPRVVGSRIRATGVNTRKITEKLLKQERTLNGYMRVTLSNKGETKRYLVHRLVGITFIDNPQAKPCVNHKNGIKQDNYIGNLEWCTHSENERHSYKELGKKITHSPEARRNMSLARKGDP